MQENVLGYDKCKIKVSGRSASLCVDSSCFVPLLRSGTACTSVYTVCGKEPGRQNATATPAVALSLTPKAMEAFNLIAGQIYSN